MSTLETITSLAKRRGFIFQSSEIYGGLSGSFDYGPLGVALKNNVKKLWWNRFVQRRTDMYGVDANILMNRRVWEASGHVAGFADPLVIDMKTNIRYRADHLLKEKGVNPEGMTFTEMTEVIKKEGIKSPDGNELSDVREFNMMFKTQIGATENEDATTFLRPETAQGMFVNFKNIIDTLYPDIPFGLAQIGKAFRNEISARDFLFRVREFEQMEVEYFIHESEWEKYFEQWREEMWNWIDDIGLSRDKIHEFEVPENDRAHYSKRTIDFEFDFPFGRDELYGLAYRTNYDLVAHQNASGISMEYTDKQTGEKFVPHVIEPTFGLDRTVFALLADAYREDELNGEKRVYLAFKNNIAPVRIAVSPLLKNKEELVAKAKEIFMLLKKEFGNVVYDDNGNIGKRYRRQDEVGTPSCVTIDFDTLEDDSVTVRDRDTATQERVAIEELVHYLQS